MVKRSNNTIPKEGVLTIMVSRFLTNNQLESLSRQQKRDLQRQYEKSIKQLQRATGKTNLPVIFDNTTVTSFGNFGLLESLKQAVDFTGIVNKHFTVHRHHNSTYSAAEIIDTMVDCAALGLLRFDHMNQLKFDPGYQKIKGIDRVPDERTLRYLLSKLNIEDIEKLKKVNQAMLSMKAKIDAPREIWIDIDDTVITVFGAQQGCEIGYNPRYHGRSSYKAKVAFVSGSCELLNAGLYGGKTSSNGNFLEFFQETLSLVGHNTVVKGVRMDKGFFDQKNFTYLEDNSIEYVCKARLNSNMWKVIKYLNSQNSWQELDNTYAVNEITVPLQSWERARRFVFIREKVKTTTKGNQDAFAFTDLYDYEAIVTNMEDLSPEEIWHWYNKRCNVENKIDELKTGVGIEQTSQNEMVRNIAFMWIKILSYNLLNWFRLALLPAGASSYEIPTIRRLILNVPGNVVGNGRYRHVRLAANQWLQQVVDNTKSRLKEFICQRAWLLVSPSE